LFLLVNKLILLGFLCVYFNNLEIMKHLFSFIIFIAFCVHYAVAQSTSKTQTPGWHIESFDKKSIAYNDFVLLDNQLKIITVSNLYSKGKKELTQAKFKSCKVLMLPAKGDPVEFNSVYSLKELDKPYYDNLLQYGGKVVLNIQAENENGESITLKPVVLQVLKKS
jgi:hypothetical protein